MEQQNNNISNDIFYQSLKKFINNIKASMKNNIELNKNLCENLLDELNKIKIIQLTILILQKIKIIKRKKIILRKN